MLPQRTPAETARILAFLKANPHQWTEEEMEMAEDNHPPKQKPAVCEQETPSDKPADDK